MAPRRGTAAHRARRGDARRGRGTRDRTRGGTSGARNPTYGHNNRKPPTARQVCLLGPGFTCCDRLRHRGSACDRCPLPLPRSASPSPRGAPEPRGPCWSSPKPVLRAARARRRRWASRLGISRSPASAASGYPASRPAISPGRSPAPARGSRLTRPRAVGFSTGPLQIESWCTRESWMGEAQAWWSASGYSRSRAADLCGRKAHESSSYVVPPRISAPRSSSTTFSYDGRLWLLSQTAGGFRSRPWSRGANPRHSDRDGVRAGLPRLHHPDDLRRDRKSTRLNSSHTVISYAVFCLKKNTTAPLACAYFTH